ncbi:MAG: ABC transporter permease [Oscillospiraceae bacterium]
MEKKDFNKILKEREAKVREENARRAGSAGMTLDDASRVKVLSPGMLVFKRFIRNKLAIVGTAILLLMFLFSFVGPYFYRYGQTEVFSTYRTMNADYASAKERTEYVLYTLAETDEISSTARNQMNSNIQTMQAEGLKQLITTDEKTGSTLVITELGKDVYTLGVGKSSELGTYTVENVGTFNSKMGKVMYSGEKRGAGFDAAVADAIAAKQQTLEYDGETYLLSAGKTNKETNIVCLSNGQMNWAGSKLGEDVVSAIGDSLLNGIFTLDGATYTITELGDGAYSVAVVDGVNDAVVASVLTFDPLDVSTQLSTEFKTQALYHLYTDGAFEADGKSYTIASEDEVITVFDAQGNEFATGSTFIVRDRSGLDTLSVDFKETVQQVIAEMDENNVTVKTFNYPLPEVNENGETVYNEDGSTNMIDTEITITRKPLEYAITCEQIVYMINRFDSPTDAHPFGTDGDGMDILARMMAGGRISLMVGFVVVLLETALGVIMGGIAGFFGGWVDNLIMRLVDIFYCIPSMPILIILGALFDAMQMTPYARLFWLMAVLGFLGWAGIARLVRGQILSLREQDFMVAAEATGLPTGKRIFRHLIPNVMPQLIVSATMGLGSVILTESTLSFLGLGVKHPMATWGTMINSVAKSTESMTKYSYIWIPVGLLICLTVIAFNFVGDGLRDAFDPKMKR